MMDELLACAQIDRVWSGVIAAGEKWVVFAVKSIVKRYSEGRVWKCVSGGVCLWVRTRRWCSGWSMGVLLTERRGSLLSELWYTLNYICIYNYCWPKSVYSTKRMLIMKRLTIWDFLIGSTS